MSALCPLYVRSTADLCPTYVRYMSALCPSQNAVAAGANFVRSDLGEVNATGTDFTDAIIDRYQARCSNPDVRFLCSIQLL